jgi:nickel-type superoxide dismutase maturation protease
MLRVIKVTGASLSPEYREGDYVVVTTIPFFLNRVRVGDVVVFRHPEYGELIKRVEKITPGSREFFVVGTHPNSVDSRVFGALPRETLLGRVIWHIARTDS